MTALCNNSRHWFLGLRTRAHAQDMVKKNLDKTKFRNDGTPRMKRKATYYKLGEKDHPVIIDGLKHYASVYHIALKIGCGYNTLKGYIHKHPELAEVQNEARESIDEFVASQIVRKCAAGHFPALAFYAERKMGWTQHQTIENVGALPVINFGLIPESQLPPEKDDSEVKRLEEEFMQGDKRADEERKIVQDKIKRTQGVEADDYEANYPTDGDGEQGEEFFGISGEEDFEGGMFG